MQQYWHGLVRPNYFPSTDKYKEIERNLNTYIFYDKFNPEIKLINLKLL